MVAGYLRLGEHSHGGGRWQLADFQVVKGGYDETVRKRYGRINQQSSPWAMGDRVEVMLVFSESLKEGAFKWESFRKPWLMLKCTTLLGA